jgi:hypothetical protein
MSASPLGEALNGINQFVFHTNWFLFAKKAQTSPLIASLLF